MVYFALLLILAAILLLRQAAHQRKAAGLPGGRVIYTDTSRWGPVEKALYDPVIGLTGRPDYLVQERGRTIPVEVKSTKRLDQLPYDSHIYQLAAYCALVEGALGERPPYGILHYTDGKDHSRSYAIDFTPQLETAVLEIIAAIQAGSRRKELNRSHQSPARCARCGFRSTCDQALTGR